MGVFTTKTLLNSVGVSKSNAISGAVAINWILKVRMNDDFSCGMFPIFACLLKRNVSVLKFLAVYSYLYV